MMSEISIKFPSRPNLSFSASGGNTLFVEPDGTALFFIEELEVPLNDDGERDWVTFHKNAKTLQKDIRLKKGDYDLLLDITRKIFEEFEVSGIEVIGKDVKMFSICVGESASLELRVAYKDKKTLSPLQERLITKVKRILSGDYEPL